MKKILYIIFILILFVSCAKNKERTAFQQIFFAFNTVVTITIIDDKLDDKNFNKIIDGLKDESKKYDLIFNKYNKNSHVYKLQNLKLDKFYKIDLKLYDILEKCKKYYKITDGAFDVTIGRLTALYDFHKDKIPDIRQIKKNLKYTGMDNIVLKDGKIKLLKENIDIDLGGVAKGYIIDGFSKYILNKGYKNFLVNIGGDIYASGKNKEGEEWGIGIQHPRRAGGVISKVDVSGKSIVTSGDYERYVIRKKKKYHHILNPKTGLPVWNNIVSVTVIADTAVEADYLATSIFILGVNKSKDIINKYYKDKIKYYIIIEKNGRLKIMNNKKSADKNNF